MRNAFRGALLALAAAAAPVFCQTPTAAPLLSIEDAMRRAVETQLQAKLARAATQQARGRTLQAAAYLLPQVTATMSQTRVFKQNLAAQGFTGAIPISNPVIGPFNTFDARLNLVQRLLDVESLFGTKQAKADERVAGLQVELASEQVAAAAALAYIEDLRALRAVDDARANYDLSERLLEMTQHQHAAGTATAVDIARAEQQLAVDRQNLIQAGLSAFDADVRLKRVIGASLTELIMVPSASTEAFVAAPEAAAALAEASEDRFELKIARESLAAEKYGLDSAKAGFAPTISFTGDYGFSGDTPGTTARTGSIGGQLSLPLISGGATVGKIKEAQGLRTAASDRYDDAKIQVEEDVRIGLRTVSAEKDDVEAAETRRDTAERELTLAQNRYRAGAGDNIQVVQAQAALADARQALENARASYENARINLALALGRVRAFHL